MSKKVVVGLSVDESALTFYTQEGDTITLKQCDPRIDGIMATVEEPLRNGTPVIVDFSLRDPNREAHWAEAEESSGVIKFFRVAKRKVAEFFKPEQAKPHVSSFIDPVELGKVKGVESFSENGAVSGDHRAKREELLAESSTKVEEVPEPVEEEKAPEAQYWIIITRHADTDVATLKAIRTIFNCSLTKAQEMRQLPLYTMLPMVNFENQGDGELNLKEARKLGLEFVHGSKSYIQSIVDKRLADLAEEQLNSEAVKAAVEAKPELTNDEKLAIADARMGALLEGSKGTKDAEFHTPIDDDSHETIIAVNTQTGAVVPDVQHVKAHIIHANKLKDYVGFNKLLERMSKVIAHRQHSMEDLLKFLGTADLPIADNGDIIIFKRLQRLNSSSDLYTGKMAARFVDCHTRRVGQREGSLVYMDASSVDPNRSSSCSVGLHVATLGYLSNFNGDVTIMGAVRPEDVITVPHREHTKVRVAAYHILAVLPDTLRKHVNSGGSLSQHKEGKKLLYKAVKGLYPAPNQHVYITPGYGQNVVYKDLEVAAETIAEQTGTAETVAPVSEAEKHPDSKKVEVKKLKVKAKAKPAKAKAKAKPATKTRDTFAAKGEPLPKGKKTKMSNSEIAQDLYRVFKETRAKGNRADTKDAALELQNFKTKTKKGWTALGLPASVADDMKTWL